MTDTIAQVPNDNVVVADLASLENAQVAVRKAHIFVDPAILAVLGVFISILIPGIVYYGTTNTTGFLILFLSILIPSMCYVVKTLMGVKLKVRFEDDVFIEERNGAETRIPLTDIKAFTFVSNRMMGYWIRLKFKSAGGSFRYTPLSIFSKDRDPFMDLVDDLSFAVNEKNITTKIEAVSNINNPALIEPALESGEQISVAPSIGMRLEPCGSARDRAWRYGF